MPGIIGLYDWVGGVSAGGGTALRLHRMAKGTGVFSPNGRAELIEEHAGLIQLLDYHTTESKMVTSVVCDPESGLALVADVRLDNRSELATRLELSTSELEQLSDEALILLGCRMRGDAFIAELLGDFAIAVWSSRQKTLTLARDGLGVKPICYAQLPTGVVFGSMVPWILRDEGVSRRLCHRRVADYIGLGFEDTESTFFEGIKRVPPGTLLRFAPEGVSRTRYWALELGQELKLRDNREYADGFRAILVDAVSSRLRGCVRPGVLLSGGLDSSSIVGVARSLSLCSDRSPLLTISALFPNYSAIDESAWIGEILASGGLQSVFVRVDNRTPLQYLAQEVQQYGEPFYSPNNYVDSTLLDAARAAGARIVVDGLDGDTTVGHGWEYMGELLRRGKLRRLWRLAREFATHTDRSTLWFLWRHALGPTISGLWSRATAFRGPAAPRLMSRALASEVDYVERARIERAPWTRAQLSSYRSQHWGKLTSGLLSSSFELAWRQAAVRGMHRRHPYFDRRLVEYCLSLPAEQRLARGVDRIVQRRAVDGLIPESIRTRLTKSIWAQNTADRMRIDERSTIERLSRMKQSRLDDFVDMDVLRAGCKRVLDDRADQRTLAEIWVVCALEMWLSSLMRP